MNVVRFASRSRFLVLTLVAVAGCYNSGDRPYVAGVPNQGSFSVRTEPNRLDSEPRPAPRSVASGPTTREVEQQKRIAELEARQRELNAEIERLKREK